MLGKDWVEYMINSRATWKAFQRSIERDGLGGKERRGEGRGDRGKRKLELLLIFTEYFLYQVLCF